MSQPLRLAKDEPDSFASLKEDVDGAIAKMVDVSNDHFETIDVDYYVSKLFNKTGNVRTMDEVQRLRKVFADWITDYVDEPLCTQVIDHSEYVDINDEGYFGVEEVVEFAVLIYNSNFFDSLPIEIPAPRTDPDKTNLILRQMFRRKR